MKKNNIGTVDSIAKIISSPFGLFIAQVAISLSGNQEIMNYSGAISVVQLEFKNFVENLLKEIQNCNEIDLTKINTRENQYLTTQVLREVFFEDNKEKKERYRNLVLSSLESTDINNELNKEHLITLTQICEKELIILKQSVVLKSDKNGFNNEFDYWEVFYQLEKLSLFNREEYQGYINHLIGLGLMNHSQMSLVGGDKSVYSVTQKGTSFFKYIKLGK